MNMLRTCGGSSYWRTGRPPPTDQNKPNSLSSVLSKQCSEAYCLEKFVRRLHIVYLGLRLLVGGFVPRVPDRQTPSGLWNWTPLGDWSTPNHHPKPNQRMRTCGATTERRPIGLHGHWSAANADLRSTFSRHGRSVVQRCVFCFTGNSTAL